MKKFLTTALALVCCLLVLAGCSNSGNGGNEGGDKAKAHIVLVLEDGTTEVPHDIEFTPGSNLRTALFEGGLIEEDQTVSMFVETIDGYTADVLNDGCTWLPTDENGQQIMGSFDEIIVEDGQTIYLRYYVVPDMD